MARLVTRKIQPSRPDRGSGANGHLVPWV